jgi:repressor LexA
MADVSLLIPKQSRPVWPAALDGLEVAAEAVVDIPLLGWVAAGLPVDMCSDDQRVSVPAHMVRRNTYALRVRGHSMVDDNIQDGDIIVVERRQTAENGQTVVAMINGEQVTLKKFYVERDGIRLQPANPEMAPIILRNEEIQILGIVTGVIRSME